SSYSVSSLSILRTRDPRGLHSFPTRRSSDLEISQLARNLGLERLEAEFIGEQEAAIKMFALLGFSHLLRLEDYVKDMQAISHDRSEEHTSELQSRENLVCRLLLEKKKSEAND